MTPPCSGPLNGCQILLSCKGVSGTVDNKGQNAAAGGEGGGVLFMRAFLVPGVMTAN